ncbi:VirB4 family type IV secretion system protein [Halalkalicoccus jeotgali]|uniref:Transfer complex protein n=1 Tax=Halalkalicoccus jeotgali (strain DSM 18796 / CECT 7217 / JCM 14584 / KCTC 4019 / B3) TaxID=795797 RepID=L9VVX7_HALJB|nr:transfer complex protein [Halalkalicoccus jeotgali]ELY41171.1 transfer complex protein [Halalkalicoccus jeotgali B3]
MNGSPLEGILSHSPITEWFEPERGTIIQDFAAVQRAFKHEHAVELDGGHGVVGAIKVDPASMAMYEKDDLLLPINAFAGVLSTLPPHQRGMMVDIPRSVDYTDHQQSAKGHERRLRATIRSGTVDQPPTREIDPSVDKTEREAIQAVLEMEAGDEPDTWPLEVQADIAKERATIESFYENTTAKREHYIVLEANELDAARTLSGINGGLADLDFIGKPVKERRVRRLRENSDLTGIMVRELNRRLKSLQNGLEKLQGISARRLTSAEFTEVIADAYRPDDVTQIKHFTDMVRQSPVPGSEDAGDPNHNVSHPGNDVDFCEGISDVTDEDDLMHQYRTLVMPETFDPETDGSITLDGDTLSATLQVTGWPDVPPTAFLEPLYQYHRPGVDVKIATHFERQANPKRTAKNQEHSMEDRLEGQFGTFFEDYVQRKYDEASSFAESIDDTNFAVFSASLSVTIEASTRHWDEQTGEVNHSDHRLTDAIEDIEMILKRECGLDTARMDDRHDEGWQSSIPVCNNELGENVTLRADALARQWAYQYKNREDADGTMIGLHDYLREPTRVDVGDLENGHSMGIYGTIGSGKTTSLQHLVNSFKQHHDERDIPFKMILSTPLQDLKSLCDIYGGEWIRVGKDAAVNPLNVPYVPPEKYRNIKKGSPWHGFLNRFDTFLYAYYDMMDLANIGEKRDTWTLAAKEAQRRQGIERGDPESYRNPSATIPDVIEVLEDIVLDPDEFVRERLANEEGTLEKRQGVARDIITHDIEAFEPDGRFSHFCERSDLDLMDHDVIYLDHQDQEQDQRAGGLEMMMRLSDLHEQQKAFEGHTAMCVDEFHYMLSNPRSAGFFKRLHRHARHWGEWIMLATQEIGDLFETSTKDDGSTEVSLSESAEVIYNNQAMQLYHHTKEMNPTWADILDLTPRSQQYIRNADMGKKSDGYSQALFVVDEDQYPLRIEMSDDINPRQFAVYQHDPTDHPDTRMYLANYTDDQGRDPCNWGWT